VFPVTVEGGRSSVLLISNGAGSADNNGEIIMGVASAATKVAPSNIADFIDKKVNAAEQPMTDYLARHAFMAQVVFATQDSVTRQASIFPVVGDLAKVAMHPADSVRGFADMFRFGAGLAETIDTGSPEPVIRDVVRGANIVALLYGAKNMAAARVRLAAGGQEAALLCDVPGGACAPMSATFALRKSGVAPRINVADLVRANGGDPAVVGDFKLGLDGVESALKTLKLPHRILKNPTSMAELEEIVRAQKESAVFGVKITSGPLKDARHAMVAFIEDGQFKIWDRTGNVVSSLAELEKRVPGYKGLATATPTGADRPLIVIDSLSVAKSSAQLGLLTLKMSTMLAVSRQDGDPQMVAEGVEASYQRADGTIPEKVPQVPIIGGPIIIRRHVAPRSDWLTGVKYRLNHLGYGAGRVVHLYDDRCKAAIRAFQHDYRLKVDAIPGPQTQGRLVQVCGY